MAGWMGAVITSAILNGICQGLIVTVLVWLALRAFPGIPAATRHAVWSIAFLVVAALPLVPLFAPVAAGGVEAAGPSPAITLPSGRGWLVWVIGVWVATSILLVARVAWSFLVLQRLKHRAVPPADEYRARFDELQRACPGHRRAELLVSDEIPVPVAAGLTRPAVLVPSFLIEQLSEAELGHVLTHELAHLRRGDDWMNLAQRLLAAVAFFHPAVLWIGRRLCLEREIACDDWVVALTGTPRPYAACLTKLAAMMPAASPRLAPGAVSRKPQISIRVEALLAKRRESTMRSSKSVLALSSAALALASTAVLPVAPVSAGEPPVPVLQAQHAGAPVPAMAYARPVAVHEAPRLAEVRKLTPHQNGPVAVEELTVAAWRGPAEAYYVVCLHDVEPGWIQVFWVRVPRSPFALGRA
jgi:beta-lactamase regulating signal transducer with metallopeptidase domain